MLDDLHKELERLSSTGRLMEFHTCSHRERGRIEIRGKRVIDFSSWDFLNLNAEPAVKRALHGEAELYGIGSCSPRLSAGTYPAHISLELRIANFLGTESALLFSSTNQALISLISALVTERDCIILDELEHTPVIDAAHLVNADVIHFDPARLDLLPQLLERSKQYRRKFLFIESLSPTNGETPNLAEIAQLCERAGVLLVIDESYALGALGLRGAGGIEEHQLASKMLCVHGSLARGLGTYGAFISGSKAFCSYILNRSRTFNSENVLPACIAAAAEKAIDVVELQHAGREKIKLLARRLRSALLAFGLESNATLDSPIVAVRISQRKVAEELVAALFQRGYYAEVLSDALVLDHGALVRFIINVAHSEDDIDRLAAAFGEIYKRILG